MVSSFIMAKNKFFYEPGCEAMCGCIGVALLYICFLWQLYYATVNRPLLRSLLINSIIFIATNISLLRSYFHQ